MAGADDPAIVLEQFTNDASNLAPEITHLMEEIEAKDRIVRECEATIKQRDQSLQRHVKVTGGVSTGPFPREDSYVKVVQENYERALAIQDEKQALAEKACTLLARHTKRLDALIRELVTNGGLELDDTLSSLLNGTATTAAGGLATSNGTNGRAGANGTYGTSSASLAHVTNGNAAATAPASTTLATSGLSRLVTHSLGGASSARSNSPVATPTSATQARSTREGSTETKQRRRLNLPNSVVRPSSLGPGTPKAGTPQPRDGGGGRAGSVPRGTGRKDKGGPAGNRLLVPPKGGQVNPDSKAAKSRKKKGTRPGKKGGVSDADDSALSNAGDESGSERLSTVGGDLGRTGKDGAGEDRDVDMAGMDDDDEGGDTNLYCTCRSVSYGNMVACDSDDCPYEWFHWNCVGLSKEPPGKWYCEECKTKLGMK